MASWIQYTCVLALFLLSGRADAQDICACSPSSISFQLNFSGVCPPVEIVGAQGAVAATFCQISPLGDGDSQDQTDDLVPVTVYEITAIELGQNFQVIGNTATLFPDPENPTEEALSDGDEVTFTSIIDTSRTEELEFFDQNEKNNIPKVLQINIFGKNKDGDQIVNFFAISYSNNCSAYEVIEEGSSAGWTDVVSSTGYANSSFLSFHYLNFNSLI